MHTLFRSETENGWDKIAESIARQAHWRGDLLAVRKDGATFPVAINISKSASDALEGESMICFVRDVTQEREVDQMKSEFITITSHELRTPLTSIKNAVDLILTKKTGDITATQEKFLSMAQRNINRLNALINDLLNIGKIEAGKMELHLAEMDIQEAVEKTWTMLKSLADKKSLSFQMRMASHLPAVYADAARIEEVLINLMGNAIKFTPEQGAITVEAHPAQAASAMPEGGQDFVEISIKDTGIGISEQSMKHLFEKFYQAESSLSTEKRSGTGLGLAISQEIVKLHGGIIRCKSKEGEGTTFSVMLPVASKKKIFYHALDQEIAKARQQRTALSIVLIEIQDFDRLIEVWGKEASAKAVATVEERIKRRIRRNDRYHSFVGTGKIVLIMPNTKREQAQIALNRHQQSIGDEIVVENTVYPLAFITSIATFPEDGISAEELVTFAKKHLE
jgi:diguanylate cyclase (GGDEF)-like protein